MSHAVLTLESNLLMGTFTATGVPASRRSTGFRIVLLLVLLLLVSIAGMVGYAYFIARSALPQLDGSLSVKGLSAPVNVTRDAHGVPAIEPPTSTTYFSLKVT